MLKYGSAAPVGEPAANDVVVQVLAAPINPSDINMIEGTYGVLPKLPAVAGKECVAIVKKVGQDVKALKVGDHVISGSVTFGSWRNEGSGNEKDFLKVSPDLPLAYAATLHVNPCTAYRMLRDFVQLKPGDVVMQNAANSMVGLAVIQMARAMGVRTINVIRSDRPDADDMLRLCENLGGDINVLDTFVNTPAFKEILADLPPVMLGFNSVGGDSATEMARALAPGGTLVTYGGMSKRPMSIPTDLIIQRGLQLKGFWISRWHEQAAAADRARMLEEISAMIQADQLTFFYEMVDFDDFNHALQVHSQPYRLRKTVLLMAHPDRFKEHDAKTEKDYWHFNAPNDA